jgi:signal transduction histidine kinase
MWFGMRNGLLMVEPHNIHDNPIPPPVVLERVSLDGQVVALYDVRSPLQAQRGSNVLELRSAVGPLRIPPDHRKLEFEFAALTFTSPENVQFRYRLAGFDDGWVDAGLLHDSTYPRLPAGRYEFHVVACNTAGEWNETDAALRLEVAPFVWETWWFRSGVALVALLFAGGSVFLVARRRYRRKLSRLEARRALEQERARIAKDIHDDLGASLTRITLLSQPSRGGPDDGETAIASLEEIHATSRQLTRSMEEVVWAVNPEHDTFDGLANYLSNYAQSFLRVAGVRCRLELPMQLPKGMLSAEVRHNLFLAFKEALNNVAKHANATEVRISLAPDTTGFTLLIEDNGWGLETAASHSDACPEEPKRPGHGNGLANMRSRLREIGGTCELQSLPGAGTKVTLKVNYKRNHELH